MATLHHNSAEVIRTGAMLAVAVTMLSTFQASQLAGEKDMETHDFFFSIEAHA